MTNVEMISVALPPDVAEKMREAVDSGEYGSANDVIRDALSEWSHKRDLQNGLAELRKLWRHSRRNKATVKSVSPDPDELEKAS
ncbi:MAG TPA: type II toxin-antitoxin system ParD family antitoxin [Acidobacteriaceae bacterium]|jgi:antitoxin ParD1/3/4|nr:type II toxin-antitoxin system ParD family antitoxin [Acidobacteriaceae bacterium]